MPLTTRERAYIGEDYIRVEKRVTNLGGLYSGELIHRGLIYGILRYIKWILCLISHILWSWWMNKHEANSSLLVLVLFALFILIVRSTNVLSALTTLLITRLFIYPLTAPGNLVELSYQALYHRYRFNYSMKTNSCLLVSVLFVLLMLIKYISKYIYIYIYIYIFIYYIYIVIDI